MNKQDIIISNLKTKPHSEWTEEDTMYWLEQYAKAEMMEDYAFELTEDDEE